MEELKRAEGTPEDARMEVLLHDPAGPIYCCVYSTKRFDIEYEGDLMDFSIESNLAFPLEAKSWVLLDARVTLTKRIQNMVSQTPGLWNYHLLLDPGASVALTEHSVVISWTLTNITYRVLIKISVFY